ncbi:hypothetical protein SAMN05444279_11714 [Ruegeria intermedia]|uniref:Uncharacterized protein n=1 Tax=Ruegeria intermedia TaxID=996115 RepID=A0A1M4YX57_9RHOB|nr:hypothetical protein [Ruegeria intermedia]SHF10137.1 hypothetical protein SAMN05444279_11714 [Ruegeria intermedia]
MPRNASTRMSIEKKIWLLSGILSAVLMLVLFKLWVALNRFDDDPTQLPDVAAVDAFLAGLDNAPDLRVKTGIFIKSFSFVGASDVRVSGYVWQHYLDGAHDAIRPGRGEAGFLLPEAVDVANGVIQEAYRMKRDGSTLIGWYFEQTLRQSFDYTSYPFDHKTVWVRF